MFFKKLCLVILSSVALAACAKVDSSQIKSGGIYGTFTVRGDSTGGAVCEATFQVGTGSGTFMSLEGDDHVLCDGKSMSRSEMLGVITYSVSVPYDLAKTYSVSFTRKDEPEYLFTMQLPEPLTITTPAPSERVNGSAGVDVRWTLGRTTEYDVLVQVSGRESTTIFGKDYPDKGSRFISADDFKMPAGSTSENFTVRVARSKAGTFPSGLGGGKSWGVQEKSVTFTVSK